MPVTGIFLRKIYDFGIGEATETYIKIPPRYKAKPISAIKCTDVDIPKQ